MSSYIEPGTTIFVDANVLLYAVSGHGSMAIHPSGFSNR